MHRLAIIVCAVSIAVAGGAKHVVVRDQGWNGGANGTVGYQADIMGSPLEPTKQAKFYGALKEGLSARSGVRECREVDVPRSKLSARDDLEVDRLEVLETGVPADTTTLCDPSFCPDLLVLVSGLAITTRERGADDPMAVMGPDGTVVPVYAAADPSKRTRTVYSVSYVFWDNVRGRVISYGRINKRGKQGEAEEVLAAMGKLVANRAPGF